MSIYRYDVINYINYIDQLKDEHDFEWCYSDDASLLDAERLGAPVTTEEWTECAVEDLVEQRAKIAAAVNRWGKLEAEERHDFLVRAYLHNGTACLQRQAWDSLKHQVSCLQIGDTVLLYGVTQTRPVELWSSWQDAWERFIKQTGLPLPVATEMRRAGA